MKVLFDPVYTSSPSTCSTAWLMWEIVEELMAERDDIFFLFLVPKSALEDEKEVEFMNRYPDRVKLIPYTGGCRDRMRELGVFPLEFADLLHPASLAAWDVDAIVTSRITQLAMFKINSARRSSYNKGSMRMILGMEEMPLFQFSQTVAWHEEEFIDTVTLANYMAADKVLISSFWGKERVMEAARKALAPSRAMALFSNVKEGPPATLERLKMKDWHNKPLVTRVVFCGRAVSSANFGAVAETFRKQFSFPCGKGEMEFLVSTHSAGVATAKFGDMSMVSIEKNGREEFYEFLEKRATVALNLSLVNDFSMSTYEMLLHGVPVIVYDKDWTKFLGPTYPFRVNNEVEAYAMVSWIAEDYSNAYEAFFHWEENYWSQVVASQKDNSTPKQAARLLLQHEKDLQGWLVKSGLGSGFKDTMHAAWESGDEKVDIDKALKAAGLQGPSEMSSRNVVGRTPIFQMVKQLALIEGFKDTLETGVVIR